MPEEKFVNVTVDGISVSIPAGTLLIEAAGRAGVHIPRFCYHPKLSLAGACRLCAVQVEKTPKLQTACTTPVAEGMVAYTNTPEVSAARKSVLEMLLVNHPLDCPVCDAAGECPLQDYSHLYGPNSARANFPKRRAVKAERLSPLVVLDMERCILCYRCTRFMDEVAGDAELAFFDRGSTSVLGTFDGKPLESKFQGNIIELCPCGALTSEPYRFRARPQDLAFGDSICGHCAVGCAVRYEARQGAVVRVKPRQHEAVNEVWLCDKGYFGFEYVSQAPRLDGPLMRQGDSLVPARWNDVLDHVVDRLRTIATEHGPEAIGVIGGSRLTDQECSLLSRLFKNGIGTPNIDHRSAGRTSVGGAVDQLVGLPVTLPEVERADAFVLAAFDPSEELPILWLRMRKALRAGARCIVVSARPIDAERDATRVIRAEPGGEAAALAALAANPPEELRAARAPLYLAGSTLESRADGDAIAGALADLALQLHGPDALTRVGVMMRAPNAMGAHEAGILPGVGGVAGGQIIASAAEGRLRALYLVGVDPLRTFPDRDLIERALKSIEFLVVQDIAPSATAGKADVVLAAAALPEKDGTITNIEGRRQTVAPTVQPPGEARTDLAILLDLAARLDLREPSSEFLARTARLPMAGAALPSAGAPGPGTVMTTAPAGIHGVYAGATPETRGVTTQKPFFAPGGWPLGMPGSARISPIRVGASLPAVPLSAGEELLRTADQPHGVAEPGELRPLPRTRHSPYRLPVPQPRVAPALTLLTAPLLLGGGTMLARSERLVGTEALGTVDLNSEDAGERGISDGDHVALRTHYGRVEVTARFDWRMPRGRVFLAENAPGVRTNVLLAWNDPLPAVEVSAV